MEKHTKCSKCSSEFDAEIAYNSLKQKYNDLADLMIQHFSESSAQIGTRSSNPSDLVQSLTKIVGGTPVPEGKYPECCLIGYKLNSSGAVKWLCTGVLIHPRMVLSAAHCYFPNYRYVVALNTINMDKLTGAEIIDVRRMVPHPYYYSMKPLNDIAVLSLVNDASTPVVQMATHQEINQAASVRLVGFGNNDYQSTRGFGIKREVTVDIESMRRIPTDRLESDEARFGYESDLEFVAGGNGYDSCNGDSGGPAYILLHGQRKLAGLTSRSVHHNTPYNCGAGGVYTRVDMHMQFIMGVRSPVSA